MDKDRKAELLAHLEKQSLRLHKGGPGAKSSNRKRKGPPVRFPQAYSRDPNALFVQKTTNNLIKALPAPMNSNNNEHPGNPPNKPVKYSNVRLACNIGPFFKDTAFEVATVDYYRGQVKLFSTESDFLEQDAVFADTFRVESKKRYNNQFYLREILEFLQRGHSLLDTSCRCFHKIDTERASEIGISMPRHRPGHPDDRTSNRDDKCLLSKARCERTSLVPTSIRFLIPWANTPRQHASACICPHAHARTHTYAHTHAHIRTHTRMRMHT